MRILIMTKYATLALILSLSMLVGCKRDKGRGKTTNPPQQPTTQSNKLSTCEVSPALNEGQKEALNTAEQAWDERHKAKEEIKVGGQELEELKDKVDNNVAGLNLAQKNTLKTCVDTHKKKAKASN